MRRSIRFRASPARSYPSPPNGVRLVKKKWPAYISVRSGLTLNKLLPGPFELIPPSFALSLIPGREDQHEQPQHHQEGDGGQHNVPHQRSQGQLRPEQHEEEQQHVGRSRPRYREEVEAFDAAEIQLRKVHREVSAVGAAVGLVHDADIFEQGATGDSRRRGGVEGGPVVPARIVSVCERLIFAEWLSS